MVKCRKMDESTKTEMEECAKMEEYKIMIEECTTMEECRKRKRKEYRNGKK